MKKMPVFVKKNKWLLVAGLIPVSMFGSCLIFPARLQSSVEETMQYASRIKLGALSKWTLARTDSGEDFKANVLFELTTSEKNCIINALHTPRDHHAENFDLSASALRMDGFTNYVVLAKEKRNFVEMPDGTIAFVIAYEKPGLWTDGTVAVYLRNGGIVRMKIPDFQAVQARNGMKLKYIPKKYLWTVDTSGARNLPDVSPTPAPSSVPPCEASPAATPQGAVQ